MQVEYVRPSKEVSIAKAGGPVNEALALLEGIRTRLSSCGIVATFEPH
jgi:hypothetical protein